MPLHDPAGNRLATWLSAGASWRSQSNHTRQLQHTAKCI
jgi:hypothetical protein